MASFFAPPYAATVNNSAKFAGVNLFILNPQAAKAASFDHLD
jgi:hypothetical protein